MNLAIGSVVTALLLLVGHWFPWPRTLRRLEAYTYGVASIAAGFALWRALEGDYQTPTGLAVIAIAGGAAVVLAYTVDHIFVALDKVARAESTDAELKNA